MSVLIDYALVELTLPIFHLHHLGLDVLNTFALLVGNSSSRIDVVIILVNLFRKAGEKAFVLQMFGEYFVEGDKFASGHGLFKLIPNLK